MVVDQHRRFPSRKLTVIVPGTARRRYPGIRLTSGRGRGRLRVFVLGVGLQHELADAVLRGGVGDRTQQREAATLTVDGVLARREGDVASATTAALPDGEADQLQAVEHAVGEVQLGIREFAGRVVLCRLERS